ncbi:MAG: PAS domain S-box protein [Geobacteraceae bacterium]|jgi:PAS domain S-box-containing protein
MVLVGYLTLDKNGVIHAANLTGATLLGMERARLIGRSFDSCLSPEARSAFIPFLGKVFSNLTKVTCEVTLPQKENSPLCVQIDAVGEGSGQECRLALTDITGRKRAEKELDWVFEYSIDMLCVAGFDGYFKRLSPSFEKILGWSEVELLSKPLLDFIHPDDREASCQVAKALEKGKRAICFDNRYVCKDGSYKWLSWNSHPVVKDKLVIGVARDISERKLAEEVQARLAIIVESSDDAIIGKDLAGIILSWNKAAERMLGYGAKEVIGKSITLLIPPELLEEEDKILRRLSVGERIEHFDTVRLGKYGRRVEASVTISPIIDRKGRIIGASKIVRDITVRKRAESVVQARFRMLAAANMSLGDMLQMMLDEIEAQTGSEIGFYHFFDAAATLTLGEDGREILLCE